VDNAHVRPRSLIPILVLSLSCSSKALKGGDGGDRNGGRDAATPRRVEFVVTPFPNRDLDMLFVIDNSSGMVELQNKLIAGFTTFADVLRALPGGLPNLHLAVVSSDIGAGAYDVTDIPSCRHGGDQGIFQSMPRGTCGAGKLNVGERFISNVNGNTNYAGSLEGAFGCIAALGDTGCGFEHPLGSMLRSLGADGNGGAPPENANFLRPNAYLAIVILTNEDDCSAPINDTTFFDPSSRYVSDPRGPLTSFRCNEYGHRCRGVSPPRTMAADLTGTCQSAEDGLLLRVRNVASQLKGLKPGEPDKVLVSVLAGPPSPYKVHLEQPTLTDDPAQWPAIDHSCAQNDGTFADPGIRVKELTDAFGANGIFQSICSASFVPAMERFAQEIGKKADGIPCFDGVPDGDPDAPGFQPDCEAIDFFDSTGSVTLKSCAETGAVAPCWEVGPPTTACPSGAVRIERGDQPTPGLEATMFTCKA
jgi:hypothetical protein